MKMEDVSDSDAARAAVELSEMLMLGFFVAAKKYVDQPEAKHDVLGKQVSSPYWWTQMLLMVALEGARASSNDGKLDSGLGDNILLMIEQAKSGKRLYFKQTVTHTNETIQ